MAEPTTRVALPVSPPNLTPRPVSGPPRRTLPSDRNAPASDLAGLKKVAQQFEAIFIGTLLKSMRATVPESDLFGDGGATRLYRAWHDQELAEVMARTSSMGIGELIVQQYGTSVGDADATGRSLPPSLVDGLRRDDAIIGPPAPRPADPRLLANYQREAVSGEAIGRLVRLRRQAELLGGATADTLGRYQREIQSAATMSGLDPALLLAVVQEESGGDARAVSSRGALGLMQLMPSTAQELGVAHPLDPAANLRGGARYLAQMLRRYDGRLDLALAAYNAGPSAVDRAGRAIPPYAETRRYVDRVTARLGRLGGDVNRPWHGSGDPSR